jgi:hypothetical protein
MAGFGAMPLPPVVDTPPGTGPLTPALVLRHARGMWRYRTGRIAGAAFVFFVPPATLYFGCEVLRDFYDDTDGTVRWAVLAGLLLVASLARFLGAILFAGFLDVAIGDEYFRGERRTLREVLRDLPWVPLLVVDVVVTVAASIGLLLFVVPGVAVYVLFGLVGPVVVQERVGPWAALRRTAQISRPHWLMVLGVVVIPLAIEHALAEWVRHLVENDGLVAVVATEWLIAMTLLAIVGVVEVSLATELMARTPLSERDTQFEAMHRA